MTRMRWDSRTEAGFAVVGLHQPKTGENVGGTIRAAGVYGAAMVVIGGSRPTRFIRHCTNTMKAHLHMPVLSVCNILQAIPAETIPVAIEIIDGARDLPSFQHPKRAFYIFGPEDGTLGKSILDSCPLVVQIPTRRCMNLAATVNVVLYDRMVKAIANRAPGR